MSKEINKGIWDAFREGRMTPEESREFREDYEAGKFTIPRETASPDMPPEESLMRSAGLAGRAAVRGVGDIVSIVNDPLAGLLNEGNAALGGDPNYFKRTREVIDKGATAAGLPSPETSGEKLASETATGLTSASLPLGLLKFLAKGATGIKKKIFESLMTQPTAQLAGGAAAGAAMEGANQADAPIAGQIAAGVAGGLAPSALMTIPSAVRAAARPFTSAGQDAAAASQLVESSGDLAENLKMGLEGTADILPGSPRTTAEALKNPQLMMTQRAAASDRGFADDLSVLEGQRNDARRAAIESIAPAGSPEAVSAAVTGRVGRLQEMAGQSQQRAESRAQQLLDEAGTPLAPDIAGDVIAKGDKVAYSAAKEREGRLYQSPEIQSLSMELPVTSVNEIFKDVYRLRPDSASPELKAIVNDINRLGESGKIAFRDFQDLRSDLSDLAYKATVDNDGKTSRAATRMLKEMDDVAPTSTPRVTPQDGGAVGEDFMADAQAARIEAMNPAQRQQAMTLDLAKSSRRDRGERFETGAAAGMRKTGSDKAPALRGAEIPRKFLHNGASAREDAASFASAYRDQPETIEAGKRYLIGQMRDYATDVNGKINPKKLDEWVKEYQPAIKIFEGSLPLRLKDTASAQRLADGLGERAKRLQSAIEESAAGLFLKMEPEAAIKKAMNSTNPNAGLRQLMSFVRKDPDAVRGLKRGMLKVLEDKTNQYAVKSVEQNGPTIGEASFSRNFDLYEKKMAIILSKEEMAVLRAVKDDLESANLVKNAGRGTGSDTQQKFSIAGMIHSGIRLTGTAARGIPVIKEVGDALMKEPRKKVLDIFNQALLDPGAARLLLKRVDEANAKSVVTMLNVMAKKAGYGAIIPVISQKEKE